MKVYIEGKLRTRSWQDEQNQVKYTTEVIADEMTMLSRADDNSSNQPAYPSSVENKAVQPMDLNIEQSPEDDLPF